MGLSKSQSSTRIKDPLTGLEASIENDTAGKSAMRVIADIQNNSSDPWSHNDTSYDAWGRPKVYLDHSLFHSSWTFDVSHLLWRIWEDGAYLLGPDVSANIYSINGRLEVNAGATLNDISFLKSRRSPKYLPNRGHLYSTALGLPTPTALGVRDFGLFTTENGVFFRLKSDGNLYACIRSGGVETKEELINIPFDIDLSKGNVYDIQFQWRGVGNYNFFIANPSTGQITKIHTIEFLNTLDQDMSIRNPAMPVCFMCTNLGANVKMWAGCVDVTSEGGFEQNRVPGNVNTPKDGILLGNVEKAVVAIKVSETFNGKINTRDLLLTRITTSCNNESTVVVYYTHDSSIFTGTIWENVNGNDNVQYAYADSLVNPLVVDLTNPNVKSIHVARTEQDKPHQVENPNTGSDYYLSPGDFIFVTVAASNGNKSWVSISYDEEQ